MNKKAIFAMGTIALVAIVIAIILYTQGKQNIEEAQRRINELEEDKYNLILDSINNFGISAEVRDQLKKLFSRFEKIDMALANEIGQSLQLICIGQKENAIEDLAKIIENLLKRLYHEHNDCIRFLKERKLKANFHSHLEYCYSIDKVISKIEYKFILAVKEIRNTEAHELDLNLDDNTAASGLLSAIQGIAKIGAKVYPPTNSDLDLLTLNS